MKIIGDVRENYPQSLPLYLLAINICLAVCIGCTTVSEPRYNVSHGMIYNSSTQEMHNVRIVHEPTKKVVTTNSILPNRSFNLGFEGQALMANYALFTWTDDSGRRHEQIVDLPRPLRKNEEMHEIIYTIDRKGKISVRITPLS